jgi:glyoxylase-like metal-dependent hydrolase (beta-lactamase superfamily II)
MREIRPGIFHWTAFHEGIGVDVSSYYVASARALIDPMLPPEGLDELARTQPPERILLTNRHHYRHSARFVDEFGCTLMCHEAGLHEFEGGPAVEGFRFGDEVAPGISALEVDAICDEETALHIESGEGILAFADAIICRKGVLGFVPDRYMGDDPEGVKQGVRTAVKRLLDRKFDSLLFAHGLPMLGGGRRALEEFQTDA